MESAALFCRSDLEDGERRKGRGTFVTPCEACEGPRGKEPCCEDAALSTEDTC